MEWKNLKTKGAKLGLNSKGNPAVVSLDEWSNELDNKVKAELKERDINYDFGSGWNFPNVESTEVRRAVNVCKVNKG